jgi:hypothetical protein
MKNNMLSSEKRKGKIDIRLGRYSLCFHDIFKKKRIKSKELKGTHL